MTEVLKPPRSFPKKKKTKNKPELNFTKSTLPTNLQSLQQKLLSGNGFCTYKKFFL